MESKFERYASKMVIYFLNKEQSNSLLESGTGKIKNFIGRYPEQGRRKNGPIKFLILPVPDSNMSR
jgi:hypothetical protein